MTDFGRASRWTLSTLLSALGCGSTPCPPTVDGSSTATLSIPSSADARQSVAVTDIVTWPFEPSANCPVVAAGKTAGPTSSDACVIIWLDPSATTSLAFYRPAGPGSYGLEDLRASFCVNGADCTGVAGKLDVHDVAMPCGDGACGRFDGDLVIPQGASSTELWGTAHLAYEEQTTPATCGEHVPGFGLN
jgi:hypothetical protein